MLIGTTGNPEVTNCYSGWPSPMNLLFLYYHECVHLVKNPQYLYIVGLACVYIVDI